MRSFLGTTMRSCESVSPGLPSMNIEDRMSSAARGTRRATRRRGALSYARFFICPRKGRKEATGTRTPMLTIVSPMRWSIDFVHHHFAHGRRFRIFNVIAGITRKCCCGRKIPSRGTRRICRRTPTHDGRCVRRITLGRHAPSQRLL